jgi:limonene-1,2-epoxide hydrolase
LKVILIVTIDQSTRDALVFLADGFLSAVFEQPGELSVDQIAKARALYMEGAGGYYRNEFGSLQRFAADAIAIFEARTDIRISAKGYVSR